MLLAMVDSPFTIKLDVPDALVMLLPLAIVRVAIVWAACRSQIAALVMTTSVEVLKVPVVLRVPAEIKVSPEKVLAPERIKVPAPSFVSVPVPVAIIVVTVVSPTPPIVRPIFVAVMAVVDLFSVKVPASALIRVALVDRVTWPP